MKLGEYRNGEVYSLENGIKKYVRIFTVENFTKYILLKDTNSGGEVFQEWKL